MITKGHCRGLEKSHNKRKCVKVKGIEVMNQDDFDREMIEIIRELSYMEKMLQKKVDVNQRIGCNMKKPIRW